MTFVCVLYLTMLSARLCRVEWLDENELKRITMKCWRPNRGIIPVYLGEREENHGDRFLGVGSNMTCSDDESGAHPPRQPAR
jgi:hypothetical protein